MLADKKKHKKRLQNPNVMIQNINSATNLI